MKLQGRIVNWNDAKGFGFVEADAGARVFVHIKAFQSGARRPVNGELIIYELLREANNRYKADKITFARAGKNCKPRRRSSLSSIFATVFTTAFCLALAGGVLAAKLPYLVAAIYLLMSFVTFIAYALDKSAAQNGRWRTKERTLHLLSLIGGWPGAYFAQKKLRHKSSKGEFKIFYLLTVLLNLALLFCLLGEQGTQFISNSVPLSAYF